MHAVNNMKKLEIKSTFLVDDTNAIEQTFVSYTERKSRNRKLLSSSLVCIYIYMINIPCSNLVPHSALTGSNARSIHDTEDNTDQQVNSLVNSREKKNHYFDLPGEAQGEIIANLEGSRRFKN